MVNYQVFQSGGVPIKAWVNGVKFEDQAKVQLENVSRLPFIHKWVAAMPDVHTGIGATIGSVIPTKKAIVPAAVGVDIGCGMLAIDIGLCANDLPDNLAPIRSAIEAAIPHGRSNNGGGNDKGAWETIPDLVVTWWRELTTQYTNLANEHPSVFHKGAMRQLGTLGTGNHFIELCLDEEGEVWLMLHSGSRGPGNAIGRYFIELAKKEMGRRYVHLDDKDLAYLPDGSQHFVDYIDAVFWAQQYAKINRDIMATLVCDVLRQFFPTAFRHTNTIDCHHNYVAIENHYGSNVYVTRKGAVRARENDWIIIPGSMGTRSYICRGKGNPESFNSCSHGAGRNMSRTEARKLYTLEDHARATEGVECRKDDGVIDETPMAYKDIDKVMEAQKDLVEVIHTLKQVICVKG